jgi:hypothetical protein
MVDPTGWLLRVALAGALLAPLVVAAHAIRRRDGAAPGWVWFCALLGLLAAVYATGGAAVGAWGWPFAWLVLPGALLAGAFFTIDEDAGHRWSAFLLATAWTLVAVTGGFLLGSAVGAGMPSWRLWGPMLVLTVLLGGTVLLRAGIPAAARAAGLLLLLVPAAAAGWTPLPVGADGVPRWVLPAAGWVVAIVTVSLLSRSEVRGRPSAREAA